MCVYTHVHIHIHIIVHGLEHFASQEFVICLRNGCGSFGLEHFAGRDFDGCGSFAEICRDSRRPPFAIAGRPTSFAEICGDDESVCPRPRLDYYHYD